MAAETIRSIAPDDMAFAAMVASLDAAGLPIGDLGEGAAEYFQLGDGTAYGGIAVHQSEGMLRSLVVVRDRRGSGAGGTLVAHLIAVARAKGVQNLWLLTDSAEGFFARLGFARTDRELAPAAIAATRQFKDLCPASAAFMRLRLS